MNVCVRVCIHVYARTRARAHTHTHTRCGMDLDVWLIGMLKESGNSWNSFEMRVALPTADQASGLLVNAYDECVAFCSKFMEQL